MEPKKGRSPGDEVNRSLCVELYESLGGDLEEMPRGNWMPGNRQTLVCRGSLNKWPAKTVSKFKRSCIGKNHVIRKGEKHLSQNACSQTRAAVTRRG